MLKELSHRYPEKTFYLGQVFSDTTTSYKFVWFLALLSQLRRTKQGDIPLADLLSEMATIAWHPVCFFRLSLGLRDKLQRVVLNIRGHSFLPPDAEPEAIRKFVAGSPQVQEALTHFRRYVPTRFLSPWFKDELEGRKDSDKDRLIAQLAQASQNGPLPAPYWLDAERVHLNTSWRNFLLDNLGVIQAFTEYHFAQYLQNRNPNVPGIVNKLTAPTDRDLRLAREFWQFVRAGFQKAGSAERFSDIYSGQPLAERFSIDHFLPWSFVAHDLMWNLAPVDATTNSSKGDRLPDLDTYLPRMVSLHAGAIAVASARPRLLEDYTETFKMDVQELLTLGEDGLYVKYREVMTSQAQIAANQGFQTGWKLPSLIVLPEPRRSPTIEPATGDRFQRLPFSGGLVVERFPTDSEAEPSPDHVPFYSLAIAAGGFRQGYEPEPEGWVNVRRLGYAGPLSPGLFVTRVIGRSMEPTIRDGAYCVFRAGVSGTRQNRVLLVQKRDFTDPETGGGYTVKRYESEKTTSGESWRHVRIRLKPDNPDRAAFPILEFTPEDDADLQVIAEFVQVLAVPDPALQ
ncbi:MAG TPA: HNH endonuclease domain-containing protein [Candidatus Paceibacterota bacterium]|nr:HNH endonuclease domain-containing protein [Candidatus Paceibacterota bacterium]